MSSISMQKFDFEALHCRSSTGHPKYLIEAIFGLFGDIFTFIADYIAWKLLKMALEVEYMMEYQYPDLLVIGYRENLLIPQLWTRRRQLFDISLPLLRCSLICPVLPGPMSFRRTVEPTGTGSRALLHL